MHRFPHSLTICVVGDHEIHPKEYFRDKADVMLLTHRRYRVSRYDYTIYVWFGKSVL